MDQGQSITPVQQLDDDIAKWRAERRANYPSLKIKKETQPEKGKTDDIEEECKPIKQSAKSNKPLTSQQQLSLHDKMLLTDVHREEDRIIKCLQILMERKG